MYVGLLRLGMGNSHAEFKNFLFFQEKEEGSLDPRDIDQCPPHVFMTIANTSLCRICGKKVVKRAAPNGADDGEPKRPKTGFDLNIP